jgi:general secretion pathway protein E
MDQKTATHHTEISLPRGKLTLADVLKMLAAEGMVDKAEASKLFKDRKYDSSQLHPLVVIGERNWKNLKSPHQALSVEFLSMWIAKHAGMEFYRIDPLKLDGGNAAKNISQAYAERLKIMPVATNQHEAVIATTEPFTRDWIPDLERVLKMKIKLVMANPLEISRYLPEVYKLAKSIKAADMLKAGQITGVQNFEQLVEIGKEKNLDAEEQHVVNIVDWLFKYAFEQRASDIHLEPRRNVGLMRFRIDGVLHQVYQLPSNIMNAITSRIKLLGRMDMVEKRRPQDGRIKTVTNDGAEIELRLSTMPTAFGEKLVMRIFTPEISNQDFLSLGFAQEQSDTWQQWTQSPNGIILVTGPTGSGKTTTLYATLRKLATSEVNVCTVEDPIEMVEPTFNQMQVQSNINLNFADGIRTLMRQDPDIIMVGEIRDLETADMAIQAALTGHLVLSTLHTNDSCAAVTRLLDLGVPHYLIQSTVVGVMAQRLVRKLCPACKTAHSISDDEWHAISTHTHVKKPKHLYKAVGCPECRNTGYKGRVGIYEMLTLTPTVKKLITPTTDLDALTHQARKCGLKPLYINGLEKIAQGLTTIEELLKVTSAL